MRKIRHFFLTTLAVLCSMLTTWAVPYSGTSVTPTQISGNYADYGLSADFDGYYVISTAEELYGFAALVNNGRTSAKGVLTADIVVNENVLNADGTLNGTPTYRWNPIGIFTKKFSGTFDGNGHTISGLYFNEETKYNAPSGGTYVGLISSADEATIKNVGLVDSYLKGFKYVGGICGYCTNKYTTITNCYNTGTVTGASNYVGGICGYYGTQINCYNSGMVPSYSDYVGGICGAEGRQTNCYNIGTVTGWRTFGGISGSYGTQTNCYNLAGCCSADGGGISATAEEFANGKVTYRLNGSTSEGDLAWYQTFGDDGDAYPVLDNTHGVVYVSQPCIGYSNTEGDVKEHPSMDATGRCTACGQFLAQEPTSVTESNCSSFNLTANFVGYYVISNSADLYWFANYVNAGNTSANAVLTADIVVNENVLNVDGTLNGTPTYSWTPIGTSTYKYAGTFDGNGHAISGLYFNNTTDINYPDGGIYVGLISYADQATIKNVGIIDSYLKGFKYVGGICGYCTNKYTTITNCYNTGTVSGSYNVGGICGGGSAQTNCYNTGTVTGSSACVGGICGIGGTQTNCYNMGAVSGSSSYVGGICGSGGSITNCYNAGTVTSSSSYVGGICGARGMQTNCYNMGTVSGSIYYVGGICGNDGTQTNCYNIGMVSSSYYYVGGICGGAGTQTNCYYLAGCAKDGDSVVQYGVGNATKGQTTDDVAGKTTSAITEEFASGKVTYLLNGSTSEGNLTWRQTLGNGGDSYPVLDNSHGLVYTTQPCTSTFSNTEGIVKEHPSMDVTGCCTDCGKFIAQEPTLVTESNYSSFNLTADHIGYYAISNSVDLYSFAKKVNNGSTTIKAVLTADIVVNENVLNANGTLSGMPTYSWIPIGTTTYNRFSGTFDGNGHTISGLYFNNTTSGSNVGLIGYAYGATIKNVGVIDSYLKGTQYVSGICGSNNDGTITNCYSTATVSGSGYVGGICAYYGTQTNCYNTGTVSGSGYVGGICAYYGTQIDCHNTGTIIGIGNDSWYIGGINAYYGTQTNCYNTGSVTGGGFVGGICSSGNTITNCYNTGTVTGTGTRSQDAYYGGICGHGGIQTNCYNTGAVSGRSSYGGICGNYGTQTNCYYLEGCCSRSGGGVSATAEEFASGKIGYLFNGNNNNAWYQDLYSDGYPLLDNTHNLVSGYIEEDGDTYTVVGDMLLATNYEIAAGKTLSVPAGTSLTTTGNAVITNNGTLRANGTLSGNNLAGNGTFVTELISLCSISNLKESYVYKGTDYTLEDGLTNVAVSTVILGKTFTLDANATVSYSDNRNVGTATISWTNDADGNDVLSGQFEITPKTLTISNIKAENKVYDGNTATTVSYTADVFNGDEVIFGTEAAFDNKNVGNGKTVSFSYTKSGADAANYAFAKTSETTTANIEQRELEFSSITAAGKVYDGNTATTVAIAASNIVSGDVVNFGTAAAFDNKNVGTNKDVNFDFTKSGADAANYKFASATGTAKANITARSLTLSNFVADSKTYDATTNATGGQFSDDRVSGDVLEFSYNYSFADKNVGNGKDVNFSSIAISGGADKDNYMLVTTSGKATANITARSLTLSNFVADSKTYDATTNATGGQFSDDRVSGDVLEFSYNYSFADKNVANGKDVNFSSIAISGGADKNNYTLATTSGKATANITVKTLNISNIAAVNKVYDGNTATTVSYTADVFSGDVVNFGTAAAFDNKNVGTNKDVNFDFTKSGADANNYKFASATGTAKANITARELTLSNFAASNKVYDGTTSASGSFSDNRVSGDELEFSYTVEFTNANVVEDGNSVNFSNIAISGGADKGNYSLVTLTGSANADITPVTSEVVVTVAMPTLTVVYNGQGNRYTVSSESDVISCNSELYFRKGSFGPVNNTVFQTYMQNIQLKTDAGEYILGWTAELFENTSPNFSNVTFNVTDGKLIITPKTGVVVTITENSSELVYNTEEQSVEGYTYSINDELNIYSEEDFSFSGNAVAAGTTVGTYPMELSAADFSNTNSNFADVTFNIVDGALTITKAPVAPNKPEAAIETRYINTQLVALPADWAWSEYAALAMGNNTATANYTGIDKGNYVIESVEVTIIRGECLHNEGNDVLYTLEPTCTHKGYTGNLSCKLCGEIYEMGDSIPALGHDFVETVIAPTCTADGYTEHLCNRCQHIEYSDTVAATGHKEDVAVFENIVAATCTEAGSQDSVVYCSVCKDELSRTVLEIPATGHKDSVVIENIVRPTLEAAGSYDSVVYCSVCKVELSRKTIDVLASAVAVSKLPNKVEYKQGEALDVKGGKLTATYSDESTAEFEMLAGWVSGFDSEKVGKQILTVKFETVSSTLTTTFDVTVSAKDDDTAISEEAENEVSIYAYQNVIVVEAADAITGEIAVFDVNGRMVRKTLAAGTRTEIEMPRQGLYIVRVGNQAKRVVIK